jgi:hypothetical protein
MYDINKLRTIELKAGYGANQATIFYGNVLQATSTRVSGSTEFMTEIVGFDGGGAIANAFSSKSYGPGVSRDGVISDIANDLLNIGDVSLGRIDPLFGSNNYQRGRPLSDKSWKLLQLETGNRAFIDNGRLYVLADSNYSNADILVVNSASGLLGTPVRGETMVSVNILFEPNVQIGQGVQLISESEPVYNGIWRCQGLSHRGVISGAVCGEVVTKLDLLTSNTSFETIAQQTGLGALVLS